MRFEAVAFPPGGPGEPRVSVVRFARSGDYEALAGQDTSGFHAPGLPLDIERQPTIVVAGDMKESARRTFVHEEVHELMHRAFGNTPTWLNEGLADYFSTLRIDGDRVLLGEVVPGRVMPARSSFRRCTRSFARTGPPSRSPRWTSETVLHRRMAARSLLARRAGTISESVRHARRGAERWAVGRLKHETLR